MVSGADRESELSEPGWRDGRIVLYRVLNSSVVFFFVFFG